MLFRLGLGNPSKRGFSPCLADWQFGGKKQTQSKGSRLIINFFFTQAFCKASVAIMADSAIPASVHRTVATLETAVTDLQQHIQPLISSDAKKLIQLLSPVDRAAYFLALSKALNALFCLHMRTSGRSPEKYGVNSEMERVSTYHDKVAHAIDRSQAPSRPTIAIDLQAANRFIEHAIPDLSEDQKKQVREISKGSGRKRTWVRNSSEDLTHVSKKSSVAEAAAAFLVEASKELHAAHDKPSDKSDKQV